MRPRRHVRDTLDRAPYLGEKFSSCAGVVEFTALTKFDEAIGLCTCNYCALVNSDECEEVGCVYCFAVPNGKIEIAPRGYYKKIKVDKE